MRSAQAQALLDAHLQFAREALADANVRREHAEQMLQLTWRALGEIPLGEALSKPAFVQLLRGALLQSAPTERGVSALAGLAKRLLQTLQGSELALREVQAHEEWLELADHLLSYEATREVLVRGFIESPLYGRLASELLVAGVRGYLAQTSQAAENLPGARSVLRLGKALVAKASPLLEGSVEDGIKSYVAKNIGALSQPSAAILLGPGGAQLLRASLSELWQKNEAKSLRALLASVRSDRTEQLIQVGQRWLLAAQRRPAATEWLESIASSYYEAHASEPLRALLEDAGVRLELLQQALDAFEPLLASAPLQRELEALFTQHFTAFYDSPACHAALSAAP